MPELKIIVPLPAAVLNPNSRVNWRKRCKATKIWREAGYIAALDAINREKIPMPFSRATIEPHFFFRNVRRRDDDNFSESLKAIRDGLSDAGVVSDDSDFTQLPPILDVDKDNPRVELLVRSTDA